MADVADIELTRDEMDDCQDVFELFDFWDGSDGNVDACKVGDMLRCSNFNPTFEFIRSVGGTEKPGEKEFVLEEFLAIYKQTLQVPEWGTFKDFMEVFKSFDREGQGFISAAEMTHLLSAMADRLQDVQVNEIIQLCEIKIDLDGNVAYEEFINKVMKGPPELQDQ